jgi:hypothetical protein
MKKLILSAILLCIGLVFVANAPAETLPQADAPPKIEFRQAAVAPFLVGRREPHMDESMDQTLSCPINQICEDDPTIAPNASSTLTRLTDDHLHLRFSPHIKSRQEVSMAYDALVLDDAVDSPRTLAQKLGQILEVDAIFVGTVWRYRDRGAIKDIPDSTASVAFAVYLIEAQTGRQLWRGIFSATQQSLTDNLFNAKEQINLGLKWRTANEMAKIGVKEVFKNFNPQPGQ